jgi:hypothetical protein
LEVDIKEKEWRREDMEIKKLKNAEQSGARDVKGGAG